MIINLKVLEKLPKEIQAEISEINWATTERFKVWRANNPAREERAAMRKINAERERRNKEREAEGLEPMALIKIPERLPFQDAPKVKLLMDREFARRGNIRRLSAEDWMKRLEKIEEKDSIWAVLIAHVVWWDFFSNTDPVRPGIHLFDQYMNHTSRNGLDELEPHEEVLALIEAGYTPFFAFERVTGEIQSRRGAMTRKGGPENDH